VVAVPQPDRRIQRGAQVGALAVQGLQPLPLAGAVEVRFRAFGQCGVDVHVPPLDKVELAGLPQPVQAVGADRVEQPIAGTARSLARDDKGPIYQAGQHVQEVRAVRRVVRPGDLLRSRQGAPLRAHGEAAQHAPFRRRQQLPAPVDRRPERLLPVGPAAPAGGQDGEPIVQPVSQLRHAEGADTGRGQLQGERDPVQAAADFGDGGGVVGAEAEPRCGRGGALDEKLHGAEGAQVAGQSGRGGRVQWRDGPQPFPRDRQRFLAGGEDLQAGRGTQQHLGHRGDGLDDVFAVVQEE
jgi:hypothetical protein